MADKRKSQQAFSHTQPHTHAQSHIRVYTVMAGSINCYSLTLTENKQANVDLTLTGTTTTPLTLLLCGFVYAAATSLNAA